MASLLPVLIIVFLPVSNKVHATRLAASLIHYDSFLSPYFNPADTVNQRAKRSIEQSISRFAYLSMKLSVMQSSDEVFVMDLVPSNILPQFFVNISIGEPPTSQLVVMDTGSSLLWIKCRPCTPCSDDARIFDPSKSSTYSLVSCDGSYGCGSYSCSHMRAFKDQVAVDGIQFGCGHENGNHSDESFNGVLGLGMARNGESIARQLGNKFSYCTGDANDLSYSYNRLYFGDGIEFDGTSTPLRAINGHYYVNLEGISIGAKRLNIDPRVFRKAPRVNNGVIVDTGTGLSFIAKGAYEVLSRRVEEMLEDRFIKNYYQALPLCYEGIVEDDLGDFPIVTFHFEGADLVLDATSSFFQALPDVFCSSFVPSDINQRNHENLTIIGMLAQQNYNIGYDLDTMHLYLHRR